MPCVWVFTVPGFNLLCKRMLKWPSSRPKSFHLWIAWMPPILPNRPSYWSLHNFMESRYCLQTKIFCQQTTMLHPLLDYESMANTHIERRVCLIIIYNLGSKLYCDGCHMWGRRCWPFPEHLISPQRGFTFTSCHGFAVPILSVLDYSISMLILVCLFGWIWLCGLDLLLLKLSVKQPYTRISTLATRPSLAKSESADKWS